MNIASWVRVGCRFIGADFTNTFTRRVLVLPLDRRKKMTRRNFSPTVRGSSSRTFIVVTITSSTSDIARNSKHVLIVKQRIEILLGFSPFFFFLANDC
jgi:hypothetical protein